ncbi:MAG: ABC transporter substrate-binding protein [Leptospirillia bacterium]
MGRKFGRREIAGVAKGLGLFPWGAGLLFAVSIMGGIPGTVHSDPPPSAPPAPAPSVVPPVALPSLPSPPPPSVPTTLSISQEDLVRQGTEAYENGDYRKAHDLLEEALLGAGAVGLPPEDLLRLASSDRHLGFSGLAIALLLPLLSPSNRSLLSPVLIRRIHYQLALADRDKGNDRAAVRQILPFFSSLVRSDHLRTASGILLPFWKSSDPLEGVILMGKSLGRLTPVDQKTVVTRTIDLVFSSLHDEESLSRVNILFPHEFPGDYADYRLALLSFRAHHPHQAESRILGMLLDYPDSLFVSEAEQLANRISLPDSSPRAGLILPDMSAGPLKPYMRSILTGAVAGWEAGSLPPVPLLVRFVLPHQHYVRWYDNLVSHEHIGALLGPVLSRDYHAVQKKIIDDQILVVTPSVAPDPRNRFMVSLAVLPEMTARAMAAFSLSLVPKAKVAVLYPRDLYGRTFLAAFGPALKAGGGTLDSPVGVSSGRRQRERAVGRLRRMGQEVSIPPRGPLPAGVSGRAGDFVSYGGKSYFLIHPSPPPVREGSPPPAPPLPYFFLPDFDVVAYPNDSAHPFKVMDELVYKEIQNVDVIGNETFMMARHHWDMVSDIHNPLYSVSPVNLYRIAGGQGGTSEADRALARLRRLSGKPPDLLMLESYDCGAFLSSLFSGGFTTRYHMGVTAQAKKSYAGLSGEVSWGPPGTVSRQFTLFRFLGGGWEPVSSQTITNR